MYQTLFDVNVEGYLEFEALLAEKAINIEDAKIEIFCGYDEDSFEDAIELSQYLGVNMVYKHHALNKNPRDIKESMQLLLNLALFRQYNIIIFVSHYRQVNEFPPLFAKYYFKKKLDLYYLNLPGSLIYLDLEAEEAEAYNLDTSLN